MPDMNHIPGNQEPRQQPMCPPAYVPQNSPEYGTRPQFAPILPPKKKHTVRNVLLIVLAALVALCGIGTIVAATTSSGKAGLAAATSPAAAESGHIKPGQVDPNAVSPKVEVIQPSPAAPTTPAGPPLTAGQQQALGGAQDYLRIMHFSRSGLISQLEHDGFSAIDAAFGVDHAGADWMVQAAGAAQDYLKLMHFSRSGLIGQLEHDGFTKAEAEHGASAVGL